MELCWLCPPTNPRLATVFQQTDDAHWFVPMCDQHAAQADHRSLHYTYWKAGTEPRLTPEMAAAGVTADGHNELPAAALELPGELELFDL